MSDGTDKKLLYLHFKTIIKIILKLIVRFKRPVFSIMASIVSFLSTNWWIAKWKVVFCKKGALENPTNFTGKYLCLSLFLRNLKAWGPFLKRPELLFFKKRLQHMYFTGEICVIFERTWYEDHLWNSASVSSGNVIYNALKHIWWSFLAKALNSF